MTHMTTRTDPNEIDPSLKEAVVDALLNLTHSRISGSGDFGRTLFGARPRSLLNSGFLLPAKTDVEGDEVTSPIWISAHGCDLQITREGTGSIKLQPKFSLYVRVLPNEEDIKRADCELNFRLKGEIQIRIRKRRYELQNKRWDEFKDIYSSRSRHPEWTRIVEEIRQQVHKEEGVSFNLAQVGVSEGSDADTELDVEDIGIAASDVSPLVKDEHYEPLSIPHKWMRLDIQLPSLDYPVYASLETRVQAVADHENLLLETINKRLFEWLECADPESGGLLWAFRHDEVKPSQYGGWNNFLSELSKKPGVRPYIKPKWDIRVAPDWLDTKRLNVHITLENRSDEPKQHFDETDPSLFQVSFVSTLPVGMHQPLRLERVEPSYRYNQFLNYPAMGFNGGVCQLQSLTDEVILETTWAPRYSQPRLVPTAYKQIEMCVSTLAKPESLSHIEALPLRMREWIFDQPAKINRAAGLDKADLAGLAREEAKFIKDMKKWEAEAEAIEAGLAILRDSKNAWAKRGIQPTEESIPYEAWLAMNEAMADLMQDRFKHNKAEWRLFQLAFILANLPAIASRLPAFREHFREDRDDAVTLLYFPTGGGKSEAFFGLLLFTLFFDRLRGKTIGVTAMIRYPLRLLTIQQAQRASRVLAKAELVRRKHSYGGLAFSIGFWVGSGGSPNRLNGRGVSDIPTIVERPADIRTEERLADSNETYRNLRTAWRKLPQCPFCGHTNALRRFPKEGGTLAHVCTNEKCAANEGGFQPLPFYICDDDIYDFAPSVVLGTVDKLALIGHSSLTIRRVLGMFGVAPWRNIETGRLCIPSPDDIKAGTTARKCEGLQPAYPNGVKLWIDPFPALLIQDEAHLLDESLGTFAGLFESTLDAIFGSLFVTLKDMLATTSDGSRRRAKIVAASATVADPERQLEHLYQRHSPAIQFPHPGPDLYNSFYAAPAVANEVDRCTYPNIEMASKIGRVYVGFMTNGRPHTATSVAVLSNFHVIISGLFQQLVPGSSIGLQNVRTILIQHLSHGMLRPIYEAQLIRASATDLATLVDLHRIALTYVTNKKGGDQIMAAEAEETRKRHVAANLDFSNLGTRLITGSVDQGAIQDVVDTAQKRAKSGEEFFPLDKALRSIIATSAVSHGVDIEELNAMFFAGLPSDVAEYIQASSRVGRTHVGFCVLIPTPQRRRDRYVLEVFDQFHRFLERMVQPAAIDRWAERAIERVIPSLFQAYVCGVTPSSELITRPEEDKALVRPNDVNSDITRVYRADQLKFLKGMMAFFESAIGLDSNFAPDDHSADFYRNIIQKRIRHMLDLLSESGYRTGELSGFFKNQTNIMFKPMTSLRDVDEPGLIHLSEKDQNKKRQNAATVKTIMNFICNGTAEMGDSVEEGA